MTPLRTLALALALAAAPAAQAGAGTPTAAERAADGASRRLAEHLARAEAEARMFTVRIAETQGDCVAFEGTALAGGRGPTEFGRVTEISYVADARLVPSDIDANDLKTVVSTAVLRTGTYGTVLARGMSDGSVMLHLTYDHTEILAMHEEKNAYGLTVQKPEFSRRSFAQSAVLRPGQETVFAWTGGTLQTLGDGASDASARKLSIRID